MDTIIAMHVSINQENTFKDIILLMYHDTSRIHLLPESFIEGKI